MNPRQLLDQHAHQFEEALLDLLALLAWWLDYQTARPGRTLAFATAYLYAGTSGLVAV